MFEVNENPKSFWQNRFLHLVLIISLEFGILAYSNTLNAPFYFDDVNVIVSSPVVKDLSYFLHPSKVAEIYSPYKENLLILMNSRHFGYLTFALNYKINGLNVFGYHVVNIIIHLINGILIYLMTRRLLPQSQKYSSYIGLIAGMLFVSHPLATQSVTYIVQRFTSLATLFYLFAILMYLKFRDTKSIAYFVLAMVSAALGMLTKEITFTLPITITLVEMVFYKSDTRQRIKNLAPFFGLALLFVLLLFGFGGTGFRGQSSMPRFEYFITQLRVMATYLRLLVFPINQTFLYDYPVYKTFFSFPVMLCASLHASLIAVGVFLILRLKAEWRIAGFGILWFYITSAVESSVFPINDIIMEHRTYLPSAGLFIAFASVIAIIYERLKAGLWRFIPIAFSVALVLVLGIATYTRNNVWKDEIKFWEDNLKQSPGLAGVHLQLGAAYGNQGDYIKAIRHCETALKLNPDFVDAHINLAHWFIEVRSYDLAMEHLQATLRINPNAVDAYINMGRIYFEKGILEEAIKYFQKSVVLDPLSFKANYFLGTAFSKIGENGLSIEYLKKTIELKPNFPDAYNNLAIVYKIEKKYNEAEETFKKAKQLDPQSVDPHMNLGYFYFERADYANACAEFKEALKLDPTNVEAAQFLNKLKE